MAETPRERTIAALITDNWYRIARYDNPKIAAAAIVNIAHEIEQRISVFDEPAHG